MAQYAVCYDLDTKAMKADGYSDSEVNATYQVELARAFAECGLTRHLQYSMYATEDSEDALATIVMVPSLLKKLAPRFCQYVKNFLIVRIEDQGDITKSIRNDKTAK